jgi:hypothetical protein
MGISMALAVRIHGFRPNPKTCLGQSRQEFINTMCDEMLGYSATATSAPRITEQPESYQNAAKNYKSVLHRVLLSIDNEKIRQ